VLPRGAVDLARKLPISDTTLVATTNVSVVRKGVHPAVVDLLALAISQAHSSPGLFHKVGEFPTETDPEYPMSQGARDFYKNGPSFLNWYFALLDDQLCATSHSGAGGGDSNRGASL
jgi:uncharacterized protein